MCEESGIILTRDWSEFDVTTVSDHKDYIGRSANYNKIDFCSHETYIDNVIISANDE